MNTHKQHNNFLPVSRIAWLANLIAVVLLAGCGGGGGSSSNDTGSTIAVTPSSNTAPLAYPSALSTNENIDLNGTLIANDADGDQLIYSIVDNGAMGTAVITNPATGEFTYTPNLDDSGTDSFTLKANDGKADSNIAMVTVQINPVNSAPVATGQCGTTFQANTYLSSLSATDPDSPMLTYALINPSDGTPAGNGPIPTTKGGTVEITDSTTGDYTYQPDTAPGNKRGKDSFEFQVTDTGGLSDIATEIVIVNQTIMPLGDSITSGTGSANVASERTGYRRSLQDILTAAGYTFDFVGTDTKGIDAAPGFDYNNEGHGGWSAAQLRDGGGPTDPDETDFGIFGWLEANPADIVLMHAGTNQLTPVESNAQDVAGLNSTITEIRRWKDFGTKGNPVTTIVALITNWVPENPDVTTFNNRLHQLVWDRIEIDGDSILEVNMQTGAGLVYEVGVDMSDSLHPNVNGYDKMAPVWFKALEKVLDKCPSP